MSGIRRRSSSSSRGGNLASPVSSEDEGTSLRNPSSSSFRVSRRSTNNAGSSRIPASGSRTSRGTQLSLPRRSTRTRRQPTNGTIVESRVSSGTGRSRRQADDMASSTSNPQPVDNIDDEQASIETLSDQELNQLDGHKNPSSSSANNNNNNGRQRKVTVTRRQQLRRYPSQNNINNNRQQLSWYERLMPECFLTMTSPITGYESRLDSDVEDDDEYEILERQRLKRNKRVRRRLLTLVLLAAAASAFMYSQGRLFRKVGVRATMSGLKHRLEDGLSKSIQETMGK